jgi:hypothetical protein
MKVRIHLIGGLVNTRRDKREAATCTSISKSVLNQLTVTVGFMKGFVDWKCNQRAERVKESGTDCDLNVATTEGKQVPCLKPKRASKGMSQSPYGRSGLGPRLTLASHS